MPFACAISLMVHIRKGVLSVAVSEAQKRASKKYFDGHYRQVRLNMQIEEAEALEAYCKDKGISRAGLIRKLIRKEIGLPDITTE